MYHMPISFVRKGSSHSCRFMRRYREFSLESLLDYTRKIDGVHI
jgi:hypothetical protein